MRKALRVNVTRAGRILSSLRAEPANWKWKVKSGELFGNKKSCRVRPDKIRRFPLSQNNPARFLQQIAHCWKSDIGAIYARWGAFTLKDRGPTFTQNASSVNIVSSSSETSFTIALLSQGAKANLVFLVE